MRRTRLWLLPLLVQVVPAFADDTAPARLRGHVVELASDRYEGRGAGYPGGALAAGYLEAQFREIGLVPAGPAGAAGEYRQRFSFEATLLSGETVQLEGANVIGLLAGNGSSDEFVVLGAHFDGQGRVGNADFGRYPGSSPAASSEIWNSADDNASGVAVLLEVARTMVKARTRPKRSIIFVAFDAEEHGLDGSWAYVKDPPFPLERHVAMVNLEKLGRLPEVDLQTASSGTHPIFPKLTTLINAATGMEAVSVTDEVVEDTDHYPFIVEGVPGLVLGTVNDVDTHQPTDTAEKLDYVLLSRRADYVGRFLLELANSSL